MSPEDNPLDDEWENITEEDWNKYWDGLKPNLELPEAFNMEAWDE